MQCRHTISGLFESENLEGKFLSPVRLRIQGPRIGVFCCMVGEVKFDFQQDVVHGCRIEIHCHQALKS